MRETNTENKDWLFNISMKVSRAEKLKNRDRCIACGKCSKNYEAHPGILFCDICLTNCIYITECKLYGEKG